MSWHNCSSLIWWAYKWGAVDIDGNGGTTIIPDDIVIDNDTKCVSVQNR